ncbi:MAG: hypothetical protein GX930_02930 [Clostridia bacterium]|nr:hypothetical protein [Clostridia bacterium]
MADADIEIPGLVEKGKLLTLSQKQALEWEIADDTAANRENVLTKLGLGSARIITADPTAAESVSRWVTNPYIAPALLAIGIAGIVLEVFTVGWGVAGTVGLLSIALYFGGHMIAGLTGWESVLLFLIGIILLLVEAFLIPGFGFAGIGGIIAVAGSIILASPSIEQAAISLIIAIILSVVLLAVSFKFVKTRKVWSRLVLGVKQEKGLGYVAPERELEGLLGKQGVAVTPLRPSGTAKIEGDPIDVVTEGGFIPREAQVKVVKVEGTRIVVREIKDTIN